MSRCDKLERHNGWCVIGTGRHALPPRAHNHNGLSASDSPDVTPLSRGLGRHDSSPKSMLERFRPVTSLGVALDRFSAELTGVNGMPPPAPGSSLDAVSMATRRNTVTSRSNHLPTSATAKTHRAIKCYHCRMCEQVTEAYVRLIIREMRHNLVSC